MIKKTFICNKDRVNVFNFLLNESLLTKGKLSKIFSSRDVKVNGKRVNQDGLLNVNDVVEIFYKEVGYQNYFSIIYEDENILIVNKKGNIEVISEGGNLDIVTLLKNNNKEAFAVHRLDRGTEGLVVLAKHKVAERELLNAFKYNKVEKRYYCVVKGYPKQNASLQAYLIKDDKKGVVTIVDNKVAGSEKITTDYNLVTQHGEYALLSVKLITGKTHQIRAHLAHVGLPIIGDGKYGEKQDKKRQMLCAYNIKFNFDKGGTLLYLNEKEFKIEPDFVKDFILIL